MKELKKITIDDFEKFFRVKRFKGLWDCYGTWNGLDMYEIADSADNARIAMWERLKLNNWI